MLSPGTRMETEHVTFEYAETGRYFAQIADGMEDLGVAELTELGAADPQPIYRGIHFGADPATLYKVSYASRLVSRVLAPLTRFACSTPEILYERAKEIPWPDLFAVDQTFAVFANVSHSKITHSRYAALRVKDAVVDLFRDGTGKRPSIDTKTPDVWIHLHLQEDKATISLETTGGNLGHRGYRTATRAAPLNETLAAAIIRLTEWDGEQPLYDPMCGSGTLLCEAMMHHCRIPAGYFRRRFGFEFLPDFDAAAWERVRGELDDAVRPLPPGMIAGSDAALGAIQISGDNCRNLPSGERIDLKVSAFEKIKELNNTVIVCNPPAGIRLDAREGMDEFIKSFGDFLKQRCTGSTAFIYFTDRQLIKRIGLRTTWKKPLKNGPLDGRLVRIDLY
jgi:23S rRNA (guanine2445-N2)-methyltransferase